MLMLSFWCGGKNKRSRLLKGLIFLANRLNLIFTPVPADNLSTCSQASLDSCTYLNTRRRRKKKKRNGSLPVVVLWRLDFIQASGSGIISMQMFFTVNSRSDLRGESEDESGESEECFPEVEKRTEIFFLPEQQQQQRRRWWRWCII